MTSNTNQLLIEGRNLVKQYQLGDLKVNALNKINISVHAGEFMALAGPSGSGKTTLLNLFGGIDRPSEGEVLFEGVPLQTLKPDPLAELRAEKIGFIFQTFNLIPVLNAVENVEYPLLLLKYSTRERKELAQEALKKVGLAHLYNNRPNQMSGGQRQRLAIARALVKKPKVILADEPTANLDRKTGTEILELMEKLNAEEKVTFVLSSHDPSILSRVQRVFHLRDGEAVST